MQPGHWLRGSLYTLVCLATLCLWMGEDAPAPYPWLVILCAVAAHAFTDHWDMLVIPRRMAPVLGLSVTALFLWEESQNFKVDPVMPLGHYLVYLQVIVFFHKKNPFLYWAMLSMSFLQIAIAVLHNNRLTFAFLLVAYMLLGMWTVSQLLLLRDASQCRNKWDGVQARERLWQRVFGSLTIAITVLTLAFLMFLLIPRTGQTAWSESQYLSGPARLTGFDEQIQLGQLGSILESDDEVMRVHVFDENDEPFQFSGEPLWRGVALTHYENGLWNRYIDLSVRRSPWFRGPNLPSPYVRQEIRLQTLQRDILFGIRPALSGQTRDRHPLELARQDGTLLRPRTLQAGNLNYTIVSALDAQMEQPSEFTAGRLGARPTYLPDDLRKSLQTYVANEQLLLPETQTAEQTCRAFQHHLGDSGLFEYTLDEEIVEPNIDPVLDFLQNRRAGHCEYFASALALMLRSVGLDARVINGFKGGDWNDVGQFYVVRQMHAHSWVEAIVDNPNDPKRKHWITLDPTPGEARRRFVEQVSGTPTMLRQLKDYSRELWATYVLNYNASEQERAVYGRLRAMFAQLSTVLKRLYFDRAATIQWWGWLIAAGVLAAAVFARRMAARFIRARSPVRRQASPGSTWGQLGLWRLVIDRARRLLAVFGFTGFTRSNRIRFYDQLVRLLEACGIEKLPFWTARQHAEQAARVLASHKEWADASTIPAELVKRFYRVRFGHQSLSAYEIDEVERMLATLNEALNGNHR